MASTRCDTLILVKPFIWFVASATIYLMRYLLGTRASKLALTQSSQIAGLLGSKGVDVELRAVETEGDKDKETSLSQFGGVGVFAAQLRRKLLSGDVHLGVHSYKDLPTAPISGLKIVCTPAREDPRDVLVSKNGLQLCELPLGARVGTGSPRRAAQLLNRRPDLKIVDIRGNVPTRVSRAIGENADLTAVVVAFAGLKRLGLTDIVSEVLDFAWAPGQGCLAVEVSTAADPVLVSALVAFNDPATSRVVSAERAVLAGLNAGCAAPVGVHFDGCTLTATVWSLDGSSQVSANALLGEEPSKCHQIGLHIAEQLIAGGAANICDLQASKVRRS